MSPLALLLWAAFAAVALVVPGLALQRVFRTPVDPALVIPLGTAFSAGMFWAALATGQAWLFPSALALATAGLVASPGAWRRARGPSLRGAIPPLAAVVALLALTTIGFPQAIAAMGWIDEALEGPPDK